MNHNVLSNEELRNLLEKAYIKGFMLSVEGVYNEDEVVGEDVFIENMKEDIDELMK